MHPAMVVFLCAGLLAHHVTAVFLVGYHVLPEAKVMKSGLVAKKGLVLGTAIITPTLASVAVKHGLALALAAAPIAIASLATKPLIVGPVIHAIIVLQAGMGVLVLKKGVLIMARKVLGAKIALAKIIIKQHEAAMAAILAGKKALLEAKAAVHTAVRNAAFGFAANARALGSSFVTTSKAILNMGSSGLTAFTHGAAFSATKGVEFLHHLNRPQLTVETQNYDVPVPYLIYRAS